MLADRISGLLFPQKHSLAELNLPKYVPFAREGGYFVLKFDVPATQVSESLQVPLESKVPVFRLTHGHYSVTES